jgi:hypothetical protein
MRDFADMTGNIDNRFSRDDSFKQFAEIDSGFWAWDFWLKDADDREWRAFRSKHEIGN